jgi:alkylation response protein AidB-like acyl-CoA dehydrogenase
MAMKVEAARLMVYSAAACGEAGLGFISAASKCLASDAKITQIYEGTNQIQRVVMSSAFLQ